MKRRLLAIRGILELKNRVIRRERERAKTQEWVNRILSAYLALLIEGKGGVRVPAELVSEAIGKYRTLARRSGDDYVIEVERLPHHKCVSLGSSASGVSTELLGSKGDGVEDEI